MNLGDVRIGWRLLAKEPGYSAVVTLGLAAGIAACFLLLGYVRYCFNYDSQVPDAARVFVMQHRVNVVPAPAWLEVMPLPVRGAALRSGLAADVVAAVPHEVTYKVGVRRLRGVVTLVDRGFGAMFAVRALAGDLDAALSRPDTLALTESEAATLFGSAEGALGRRVDADGMLLRVAALIPDAPANSTMQYRALAGIGSALWPEPVRSAAMAQWQALGGKVYVRTRPGVTAAALAAFLQDDFDRSPWGALASPADLKRLGHVADIRLRNVRDAYFDADVANQFQSGPRGERKTVLALGAVALLILALAATNYVNLATVRTLRRDREIGMRKAIGAGAARLVTMFMAESMLVALLASALGVLLAWLLLPLFAAMVDRRLEGLFSPATLAATLGCALALGAATGLYPAVIALRMRPMAALGGRGDGDKRRGLWLRRGLSTLQFGAAIGLTCLTVAIGWQAYYALSADPGYDTRPLSVLTLPRPTPRGQAVALREAIARLPGVEGVAVTGLPLGATGVFKGGGGIKRADGRELSVKLLSVSADFFRVLGVAPLAGRMFDPAIDTAPPEQTHAAVVDMAAVHALGYRDAVDALGKHFDNGYWTIVGVAPEIRDRTLREAKQPTIYRMDGNDGALTIRSALPAARLHEMLAPLWARYFPDHEFAPRSAQSFYAEGYADDLRLARLMGAASLIAIAIAAFGIYVLAAYNVQRRSREIVLRKLHGATRAALARLVGREFGMLVCAGAALGLPLAGVFGARYLAGFVERAPMGVWPGVAAVTLAALVALAASARHTLAVLRIAPARALRD